MTETDLGKSCPHFLSPMQLVYWFWAALLTRGGTNGRIQRIGDYIEFGGHVSCIAQSMMGFGIARLFFMYLKHISNVTTTGYNTSLILRFKK